MMAVDDAVGLGQGHVLSESRTKFMKPMKGYLELPRGHSEEVEVLLFNASGIHAVLSIEKLYNVTTSSPDCAIIPAEKALIKPDQTAAFCMLTKSICTACQRRRFKALLPLHNRFVSCVYHKKLCSISDLNLFNLALASTQRGHTAQKLWNWIEQSSSELAIPT